MPKYKNACQLSKYGKRKRIIYDNSKSRTSLNNTLHSNINTVNNSIDELSNQPSSSDEENFTINNIFDTSNSNCSDDVASNCSYDSSYIPLPDTLRDQLRVYCARSNTPFCYMNELLKILRSNGHPNLPKDARTLMETEKTVDLIQVDPGTYSHIGVKFNLDIILGSTEVIPDEIKLDINVDGVDILKTSTKSFWFITGRIFGFKPYEDPFVIGIYFGKKKPSCFNNFLKPFVDEVKELRRNYNINNTDIKITVRCFICDAPACNSCKGTKGFNGAFGCGKCVVEGDYINNRQVFLDLNCPLRKDFVFDDDHNLRDSILTEIDIGLVTQFPIDYLHCVLLGVVKKLLNMFLKGDQNSRLPSFIINELSTSIELIEKSQPSDFQRRLKSITYLGTWKGNEFRTFLLYAAPVALKNILPSEKYEHFLLLHVGILILCDRNLHLTQKTLAEKLLREFVEQFSEIYGNDHIVYNVHNLIHLASDVEKYGTLDDFSSFVFESYFYRVGRLIRKSNQPIQQIVKRIKEQLKIRCQKKMNQVIISYPILQKKRNVSEIFKITIRENLTLSANPKNCWFITEDNIIGQFLYAEENENQVWIHASTVSNLRDVYTYPISSSLLSIYSASQLSERGIMVININRIASKMFCMEHDENQYSFFPIRHSQNL